MKKIAMLALSFLLSSCVAQNQPVKYQVTSTPSGAIIEVNGVLHGKTPTTITAQTSKRWVGLINSPNGWEYSQDTYLVTATHPNNAAQKQEKKLVPHSSLAGGSVHFDFSSR